MLQVVGGTEWRYTERGLSAMTRYERQVIKNGYKHKLMAGRYYRIIINYNKLHGEKHPVIIEMKIILTLFPKLQRRLFTALVVDENEDNFCELNYNEILYNLSFYLKNMRQKKRWNRSSGGRLR